MMAARVESATAEVILGDMHAQYCFICTFEAVEWIGPKVQLVLDEVGYAVMTD